MKSSCSFIPFVIALILGSCNKDEPASSTALNADSVITAWLDLANISATRDASGIYYYAVTQNTSGSQVGGAGQVLGIYYALLDLDSASIDSYQPADGDSLLAYL